jgi:peptidyl-prolyl cis-trans isomerase D
MTMLDRMRRHKGWLKWSLALVVLAFVVFYIPDFLDDQAATIGAAPNEVVAEVAGLELTAGDFQTRYVSQVQNFRSLYGSAADQLLQQLALDGQVLQEMIDEQAALAEAERQGLTVSDEELAQQIFAIPGLRENGQFIGEARYEQLLRAQVPPLTKSQFEEGLRASMMVLRLRSALTDWMAVSADELEREYAQRNERVRLQLVTLTADAFRDEVTVNDQDLAEYYDEHQAEYRMGERRRIDYVLIDRDTMRVNQTVAETDIQRSYTDNLTLYQTPEQLRASHILLNTAAQDVEEVRARAEDILAQIRAGADFATLAREVSEDEATAVNGGDLDYFSRGQMVAEFETVAFALEAGDVSDLVQTQFGFHIIQVVDKLPADTRSLDEVRAQIEDTIAWQRTDQQVAARQRDMAAQVLETSDLQAAADALGLTVQLADLFAREDPIPGLGPAPQVAVGVFQLTEDEVSGALNSTRGPVFARVTDREDPRVPALDEIRDQVRDDAIRVRAIELSRERAASIADQLAAADDFVAEAEAQGFEATETDLIARESVLPAIGPSPEVDRVAFDLDAGAVSDPITTTEGTVIVRVDERDDVTPEEFQAARDGFRDQLLAERRDLFFSAYMTRAKNSMQIQIYDDVVQRIVTAIGL